MNVLPQPYLYHFHIAPVPRLPPINVIIVDEPLQIVEFPEIESAIIEVVSTDILIDKQEVVLQIPAAKTK